MGFPAGRPAGARAGRRRPRARRGRVRPEPHRGRLDELGRGGLRGGFGGLERAGRRGRRALERSDQPTRSGPARACGQVRGGDQRDRLPARHLAGAAETRAATVRAPRRERAGAGARTGQRVRARGDRRHQPGVPRPGREGLLPGPAGQRDRRGARRPRRSLGDHPHVLGRQRLRPGHDHAAGNICVLGSVLSRASQIGGGAGLAGMPEVRNVIVIGSGPSGYTAALYAARGELKPLVFEGSVTAGGALMQTTDVENFPGFADAIMGPELMDSMRKQAERFGAELLSDDVIEVDLTATPKMIKTDSETYLAHAVIVATGSRYKELGVPGEKQLGGHGVSWCATCDGFFFRGHDIAVIGGGDSAMEEATFLTRFGKSVTIIHRRDTLRASKIMQDRALANPKIKFQWNSEVAEILGEEKVTGVRVRSTKDGTEDVVPVTGVFVAIGHDPRSDLFTGQLATDPDGYLLVDQPSTRTAIEGVFAAGDVVDRTYRQAVTAAGTGCAAALDAERWLASQEALTPATDKNSFITS